MENQNIYQVKIVCYFDDGHSFTKSVMMDEYSHSYNESLKMAMDELYEILIEPYYHELNGLSVSFSDGEGDRYNTYTYYLNKEKIYNAHIAVKHGLYDIDSLWVIGTDNLSTKRGNEIYQITCDILSDKKTALMYTQSGNKICQTEAILDSFEYRKLIGFEFGENI